LEDHRGAPLHDALRARDRMTGALERAAWHAWTSRTPSARALRAALAPAALAYGAVAALRNRLYDAGWLDAARVPAPVVRVGNLVLVSGETAGAWPLPAGPLREPLEGLARARALLALEGAAGAPLSPLFRGRLVATALVHVVADRVWQEEPLAALRGTRVTAVAGVARPERFLATLAEAGARVERMLRFPDHHAYRAADAARIAAAAGEGF